MSDMIPPIDAPPDDAHGDDSFDPSPRAAMEKPVESLPDFADGRPRMLAPSHLVVDRLGGLILAGVLGLLSGITLVILGLLGIIPGWWNLTAAGGWLVIVIWLLWLALVYSRLSYRWTSYAVSPRGIEIRNGVWWRHVINVPRSRVQHTDVRQGPIARRFGLAALVIHTAGTSNHTVALSGLEHETALRVRDYLVRGGAVDGV